MRIKNIEYAIDKFKIAANDNYEYSFHGNYKKSNKAYDDLVKIEKYLLDNDGICLFTSVPLKLGRY